MLSVQTQPGHPTKFENGNYGHLVNSVSQDIIDEMMKKSLPIVFVDCMTATMRIIRDGHELTIELKQISSKDLEKVLQKQLKEYDQFVMCIALPALKGVSEVFGAVMGVNMIGGICRATTYAIDGAEKQLGQAQQGNLTCFNHLYTVNNQTGEEYRSSAQGKSHTVDQILEIWRRFQEAEHRSHEALLGG